MVSFSNIQKEAKPNMVRKAHIDGKTKEKQRNEYHKVRLVRMSAGEKGLPIKKRHTQSLAWVVAMVYFFTLVDIHFIIFC